MSNVQFNFVPSFSLNLLEIKGVLAEIIIMILLHVFNLCLVMPASCLFIGRVKNYELIYSRSYNC